MKKLLIVAFMLCAMTKAWSSQPACAEVSTEALSQIRGNQQIPCAAGPYQTTGGCTACQNAGNMLVIQTFIVNGVTYSTTSTMPVFQKCDTFAPNEMCLTGPTILSWCIKTATPCTGASKIYSDNICSAAIAVQPSPPLVCSAGSYLKTGLPIAAPTLSCGTTPSGVQ